MPHCLLEQPPPTSLHAAGAALLSNNWVSLQRERSLAQSDFNRGWKRRLLLPAIWFPDLPSMIRESLRAHFYLLHNAGVYFAPVMMREYICPSRLTQLLTLLLALYTVWQSVCWKGNPSCLTSRVLMNVTHWLTETFSFIWLQHINLRTVSIVSNVMRGAFGCKLVCLY